MRVAIYARYSSNSQRAASIEEQVKICTEYAERNDYSIVRVYKDEALTGTNDNRPGLKKLLSDCPKQLFEAVIVYSIDRFGRNLKQSLDNADKWKRIMGYYVVCNREFYQRPVRKIFQKHYDVICSILQ